MSAIVVVPGLDLTSSKGEGYFEERLSVFKEAIDIAQSIGASILLAGKAFGSLNGFATVRVTVALLSAEIGIEVEESSQHARPFVQEELISITHDAHQALLDRQKKKQSGYCRRQQPSAVVMLDGQPTPVALAHAGSKSAVLVNEGQGWYSAFLATHISTPVQAPVGKAAAKCQSNPGQFAEELAIAVQGWAGGNEYKDLGDLVRNVAADHVLSADDQEYLESLVFPEMVIA